MIDQGTECVAWLNEAGETFWQFSLSMLWQVSALVLVLACLEMLLKKRTRAITRYCLWSLVILKLVLPVQLGTPMSVAYWITPATHTTVQERTVAAVSNDFFGPFVAGVATNRDSSEPQSTAFDEVSRSQTLLESSRSLSMLPIAEHPTASPLRAIRWKAIVLSAWMAIVGVLFGIVAMKALTLRKLVGSATIASDEFRSLVGFGQRSLGMKASNVEIRITDQLSSPAICGFWKPTILLPRTFSARVNHDGLQLVLVHELAHWMRCDLHVNCLQTFLQVLYFYNPLVWFANSMIRRLREEAVDETVLVATRSSPQQYGNTLLDVAAAELAPAEFTLRLIGVVESRRLLASRIKRIVGVPAPKSAKLGIIAIGAILTAALLLLPMAGRPSLAASQNSTVDQAAPTPVAPTPVASAQPDPVEIPAPTQTEITKDASRAEPNLIGSLIDETGAPVTDAEITLTFRRNYQRFTTKSDSAGHYQFAGISGDGVYEIEVHSKRWVGIVDRKALPRVDLNPSSQVVRNFTLPRACQLTVEVVDDDGQPVKNVFVLSSLATDNQNFASRGVTNKQGRVLLTGLKPSSEERLVATMGGEIPYSRRTLKLNDPTTPTELKVTLPPGEIIAGRAICSDGKPAAGWRINAIPTWWHFGMSPNGQSIADDGSFALPNVASDTYNVIVSIPTGQRMSMSKPVLTDIALPTVAMPLEINIDYPSPDSMVSISGHITYLGGKLERGIHIFADGSDNKHGSHFVQPGQQDFEIGPIPRGTYTIRFDSTEIEPTTLQNIIVPSEKKLEVEIKIRGEILLQGTVVNADSGKPVTKYRAQIAKIATLKGPNYVQDSNWHDINSPDGEFKLTVAGPGVYTVQVSAEGLDLATSSKINTETDFEPVRIELSKGPPLTGTIVDEQGKLVDGVKIIPLPEAAVIHEQVFGRLAPGEPVIDAPGGEFTMPRLAPGHGVIKVMHPKFAPTIVDTNILENKVVAEPLKIVLQAGATVRGRVYDADGLPQANTELRFQDRDGYGGSDDEKDGLLASVTTDADGNYEANHIPGRTCYVQRGDPWKSLGTVRHTIVTANGKSQTLDFGGTAKLTGRIIVNGTPLPNRRVQLSGENPDFGIYKAFARSDQNGTFTFWGTPPGERTLYFTVGDQSNTWVRVKTIRAEASSRDLGDLELKTATLSVNVQAEPGASFEGARVKLQEFNPIWPFGNSVGKLREHTNREAPFVFDDVPTGEYELTYNRPNEFAVRMHVEVESNHREKSVTLNIPSATASLSGKLAPSICGPDGCQMLYIWSSDGHLSGFITPTPNGTYKVENIPAGQYNVVDKSTRTAPELLAFSLREGENKILDITSELVKRDTQPTGFAVVYVLTPDGVPIPGCTFQFDDSSNPPSVQNSQSFHMVIGDPGRHATMVEYPGFKPLRLILNLKPATKDVQAPSDVEQRVQLEPNEGKGS